MRNIVIQKKVLFNDMKNLFSNICMPSLLACFMNNRAS